MQPAPASTPDLRDIVSRLGGDLYDGGKAALIPGPGHSKGDRSLSLRIIGGRLVWHSFANDDPAEVWRYLGLDGRQLAPMSAAEAAKARAERERERKAADARRQAFCRDVWASTVNVEGSPAERYLRDVRKIAGPLSTALRFAPAVPLGYNPGAKRLPALVAMATRPDHYPAGLHATFLLPDGSGKAPLSNARLTFWGLEGGAVRLAPYAPGGEVLGIAEGIETALSFRDLHGVPTWAAGSTAGLQAFEPPRGLSRLIVAADNDANGQGMKAARALAARVSKRCEVVIAAPEAAKDWNDVAQEAAR